LINIDNIVDQLGNSVACALPAFHAFTGSDYTASLLGKGMNRPFEILIKSDTFINARQRNGTIR